MHNEADKLKNPWFYMDFTVKQLKEKLKDKKLPTSGLKADLCRRLAEFENHESKRETSKEDIKRLRDLVYRGYNIPGDAFVFNKAAQDVLRGAR